MRSGIVQLLMVSAVVMGLSQTLTRERIFEPLRKALGGKATWPGYFVSCPYCASHVMAFALVPLTGTYVIDIAVGQPLVAGFLRWFLSSILVTVVAAFLRVGFWLVDEQQALARREKQLVERTTNGEPPPKAEGPAGGG
jgi:hypothetical protein